jgi:hypothetical protein
MKDSLTEVIKYIIAETAKHSKSPDDWSEITVYQLVQRQAFAKAMELIRSNLLYHLSNGSYHIGIPKDKVIEMAKEIPELKEYILKHNRVSSTNFTTEELAKLK